MASIREGISDPIPVLDVRSRQSKVGEEAFLEDFGVEIVLRLECLRNPLPSSQCRYLTGMTMYAPFLTLACPFSRYPRHWRKFREEEHCLPLVLLTRYSLGPTEEHCREHNSEAALRFPRTRRTANILYLGDMISIFSLRGYLEIGVDGGGCHQQGLLASPPHFRSYESQ